MRAAAAWAGVGMTALLLTGCTPAPPEVVHRPEPVIACDELAAPELIEALAGPEAVERVPDVLESPPLPRSSDGLGRAALLQAGGALCEWAPPTAGVFDPTVLVAGLSGVDVSTFAPHQELERHNPGAVTFESGDATLTVQCLPHYADTFPARCRWLAWSDDVVVEVSLADAPDSEYALPPVQPRADQDFFVLEPVLDSPGAQLVLGALGALSDVSDGVLAENAQSPACDDVLPADDRSTSGSEFWVVQGQHMPQHVTEAVWGTRHAGTVAALAFARLGWTRCIIYLSAPSAPNADVVASGELLLASGAAWILDGRRLVRFGEVTDAFVECSDDSCIVSAQRGTGVIHFIGMPMYSDKTFALEFAKGFAEDVLALVRFGS